MVPFDSISLHQALTVLGDVLSDRRLHFEVVAVGGGGLLLLGLISRPTKDVDVVALINNGVLVSAEKLPPLFLEAVAEVGVALRLGKNWVNNGPHTLLSQGLPLGFTERMTTHRYGGLILHLAGRFDQICFKLYAAIDQGPDSKHFADLKLLKPTQAELAEAAKWCQTQDVSEEFATNLSEALGVLVGS